jgi:hypothetical protein
MRQATKHVLRQLTAPVFTRIPLKSWPAAAGRIHDLSIPKGVIPNAKPEPRGPADINILLELLDRTARVDGAVAECGVYRGRTLVAMSIYLRQINSTKLVYGFDSFQGFGESIQHDLHLPTAEINPKLDARGFADTSYALVQRKITLFGLARTVLVPGFFETSLARCPEKVFSFAHLDCDTYTSYQQCLRHFYPRMARDGIVSLDEYNDPHWPGCNEAVDEFLKDKPESLEEICKDNHIKYYFRKRA